MFKELIFQSPFVIIAEVLLLFLQLLLDVFDLLFQFLVTELLLQFLNIASTIDVCIFLGSFFEDVFHVPM